MNGGIIMKQVYLEHILYDKGDSYDPKSKDYGFKSKKSDSGKGKKKKDKKNKHVAKDASEAIDSIVKDVQKTIKKQKKRLNQTQEIKEDIVVNISI